MLIETLDVECQHLSSLTGRRPVKVVHTALLIDVFEVKPDAALRPKGA